MFKGNEEFKNKFVSYRGGYTIEERRDLESQLFHGNIILVVATNALELGIDIGALGISIYHL